MKKNVMLSIILTGFTAMASQIVYLRELLVVFYGNELSISFVLASWLVCGALGSAVFGKLADRIRLDMQAFSLCQMILGVLLIAGIIGVKFIKTFLGVNPGEVIGLFPIIVTSFMILAPVCILMGFMFPLGCRMCGINGAYILEAIGSMAGGTIASFILIKLFDALHIVAILALLNVLASFLLALSLDNKKTRVIFAMAASLIAASVIISWYNGGLTKLEKHSLQTQWRGYEILDSKNSIYSNILMAKRGEGYSLFNNGIRLYTIPDKQGSEESVHLALLEHKAPKKVLLIGGGVDGLVEEVLKHPIEKVDYVELDPSVIEISEKNLPENYYRALKDPRVSIKNVDGRFFVKQSKDMYDCVIIHTGDPYTAENNRYYTQEFFSEVKDVLNEDGIVSFALTSSESYISKPLAEFLRSIYATSKSAFKDVFVVPGEIAYFLASNSTDGLTYDYKVLEERTIARGLDTQYVRDYYLFSKLSPEKISYYKRILDTGDGVMINRDSKPVAYYYGLIFWTTLFRDSVFSNILRSITEDMIWRAIGAFMILLAIVFIAYKRSFKKAALVAVMTGGFSSMAFQLLILLTFQTMYGYLFYKLGVILTAFMAGLAIGAVFVAKFMPETKQDRVFLIAVQGDFIILSILLGAIFSKFCPEPLFPILSVMAGFIGGAQFAIANKILLGDKQDVGRTGGLSYGADLFGSFFGAIFTGIFLVPMLGIPRTSFAIALINLSVLVVLATNVSIEE